MNILQQDEQLKYLKSIIHQDTQQHSHFFDLTINKVYQFTEPASLDFGGSEFTPAGREELIPEKKQKNDDYGWWQLSGGQYQALMNESLKELESATAFLAPHTHTRQAGIILNNGFLTKDDISDDLLINFHVPKTSCNIKENARFASLQLFAW
jgi:hypothetical protein